MRHRDPAESRLTNLTRHPRTPAAAVRGITARASRPAPGILALAFSLEGDLSRVRVPAPGPVRIGRELWQHTCFEAFVGLENAAAYSELNLAPSGEWTVYAFRGYRDGAPLGDESIAPRITVRRVPERLELEAEVALARLSPAYASASLRLGLAAVVEESDGTLSYWSLRHPPGAPDFHHHDAFAMRLEPRAGAC